MAKKLTQRAYHDYSGFNARTSDTVQLGGIYTPPELRGRGYARAAIARQLQTERERGVGRAVLFTDDDNPNSTRCYAALGFRRLADWLRLVPRLAGVGSRHAVAAFKD